MAFQFFRRFWRRIFGISAGRTETVQKYGIKPIDDYIQHEHKFNEIAETRNKLINKNQMFKIRTNILNPIDQLSDDQKALIRHSQDDLADQFPSLPADTIFEVFEEAAKANKISDK